MNKQSNALDRQLDKVNGRWLYKRSTRSVSINEWVEVERHDILYLFDLITSNGYFPSEGYSNVSYDKDLRGVNNNKIIFHLQRLNIKKLSRILKYSNRIYLRAQADHNKKQEDSFLTLIKALIGIIKI
jgi:hypothetical protein